MDLPDIDYSKVSPREEVVFRDLLEHWATVQPEMTFAIFEDGSIWTYGDARARAVHAARGLAAQGVGQGDHVISWQPNSGTTIQTWLGINYLGAVYVPFNTAYRGGLLEHVVWLSDAKVAVVHPDLAERLADVKHFDLETVIVTGGGEPAAIPGLEVLGLDALTPGPLPAADEAPPELSRPTEPWDTQSILFTSGTTGPSKGVLSSYMHMARMANVCTYWLGGDDRIMMHLPLFHVAGIAAVTRMLCVGGSVAVLESFKTDSFWETVNRMGVTFCVMMGSIATFLSKLEVSDAERNTTLKSVILAPLTAESMALARRIGVDWYTTFNMTEISCQIMSGRNPETAGTCGLVRPGAEVRIVDDNDCEVPVGTVGELIVRDAAPWAMNHGYHKNPEATAKAWRNGWFHTGDALKVDGDGNYFYIDRVKDSIRRRGENISSFEVEVEVNAHPDVREAAAIAVPSEHGEDEVMIVVEPVAGRSIDARALIEFLIPRMAHFMVPRFVRVIDALPKTPTLKVQKIKLREAGVTEDTFDREAAGIRVKRQDFRKTA
ncbi:MAG: ATP-dependent acyl-CoA ligase [Minwuia thermotolerans]|nr:MAG: ATP-dependent acyl-CoA ligase [Minwuia thermotolerans]